MASELDIINDEDLQAPLDLANNYKKLANDFDAVVASTTKLVNKLESQDATIADLTGQTKQLEKETKKLADANKKAAKSAESMAAATEVADQATGGFISRVKTLGKQLYTLALNPVVAVIAAIGVALLAVGTYFKSTNDGADKFEKILAAIGAVGDYLTNKIAALGEQIFKLFEDGNVVGEIFLFIFNRVLNLVVGAIDTFTNLLKIVNILAKYNLKEILLGKLKPEDIKALNKAVVDMSKSWVQGLTGIGGAADEVAAKLESLNNLVEAGQKLGDELRDRILSKAQAELEIEKLLFAAKDKTHNTDSQRLEALKQAVKLSEDQLKIDLDHAVRKERQFTAELLHSKEIIKNQAEANTVLQQGTTLLQDQLLEQKASDDKLKERKILQAEVFNLQRIFFGENKKNIAQIGALQKEVDEAAKERAMSLAIAKAHAIRMEIRATQELSVASMANAKHDFEQKAEMHKRFGERIIEDGKARLEKQKEQEKAHTEALKEEEEKRKLIKTTALQAVGMIGDEIFARRQTQLAEELKTSEDNRARELAAAGDDERKKLAINRKFDREQAKIKTKQAQSEKQAAIFGIIINTALGIMKASPVVPLMIATGILGAIQLALVASKPLPKFWAGSPSTPDSFIAGDRGRELVSYGNQAIVAEKPTIFSGMAGSKVFTNRQTDEILGDARDIGPAIAYGSRIKRYQESNNKVVEVLSENNKWLKRIASKPENGLIIDEEGFHQYSNRVARRNNRINRRFLGE